MGDMVKSGIPFKLRMSIVRAMLLALLLLPAHAIRAAPIEILNTAYAQFLDGSTGSVHQVSYGPIRTVVMSSVPDPIPPQVGFFQDARYDATIEVAARGSVLYVQADAPGCNLDNATVQTNAIVLTAQGTGDAETFWGVETGPGTGRFRILPHVPTQSADGLTANPGNGTLDTLPSDLVRAEVDCGGTNRAVAVLYISPGGVVFNSNDNSPVAGAKVTLIDASSGLPARVYLSDGSRDAPNPVTTGPDGVYFFPFVLPGAYQLRVQPPPDFRAPSKVPIEDLPDGRTLAQPGSFGRTFNMALGAGPVSVDYPVDPVEDNGSGLFVQKVASRTSAEPGDFVDYSVQVKNVSGETLDAVRLTDRLPFGFAYQEHTARLQGRPIPEPRGGNGPDLEFDIGPMDDQTVLTLTYRVRLTPGALQGDGLNLAQAFDDGPPARVSNRAQARVLVEGGTFNDRGLIVGKVFVDGNLNRIQDPGEPGVPGVRLFLEDGTFAITDGQGQYNFYGLRPITHVVKVDLITLPRGARLSQLSTRDAFSPSTRFVPLKRYEMHKANFALAPGSLGMMEEIQRRRDAARELDDTLEHQASSELRRDTELPVRSLDAKTLPASGLVGDHRTTSAERAGDPLALTARPPPTPPMPAAETNTPPAISGATGTSNNVFAPVLPSGTLTGGNSNLPDFQPSAPRVPVALLLTNLDNTLAFVGLEDGDLLPARQATLWIKGPTGARFGLRVNGNDIPDSRVGKRANLPDRDIEAWQFIGVNLQPGTNHLTALLRDPFGNPRGESHLTVIAPDQLGVIRIVIPEADQPADGKTPALITVRLEDKNGIPVTARTPLTLDASVGEWKTRDLNPDEPGAQVFLEGGEGVFELVPPLVPGDAQVVVSSGALQGEATVAFVPELRPFMAVGLVEGAINMRTLGAGSIVPARSRDGFEEELRGWLETSEDGRASAGGRAAFYLKGKIKGDYLLTAAYDSDKTTRERLFRDIQPDEFYPIYGDSAERGYDAQSTGKFYIRVDKRKSYLLYGDFVTGNDNEAKQLGNYNRSLTGARAHYEKKRVSIEAWASQDSTRQVIEEVRANGTSGPYFTGSSDGIVNSEVVEIITRDRLQPSVILSTVTLTRFVDYEFEPFTGQLLMRAPVPSLDSNLNPISIRITYEVDQGGDEFWVYGGDGRVRMTDWWEVGVSGVRDENPIGDFSLQSANTTVKVAPDTYLIGELARSETVGTVGDAGRVELRRRTDGTDMRIYYGRADNTFSNSAAMLAAGRVEAGAKVTQRLTRNTKLIGEAINTEWIQDEGRLYGARAAVQRAFDNGVKVEAGGRYSEETANPATAASAATPGVTPNRVRSVGAKLTLPVPLLKDASVFGEYENDVVETDRRVVSAGTEIQLPAKTRLYARHDFIDSLNAPFQLNDRQSLNSTVVGLESEYMKDGKTFNEYRMRDATTGREAEAAIGLRNLWHLAEGVRASTTFERINPVLGDLETESTAGTAGIEYTRNPDWKGTARIELRAATVHDSLLNTFGYARRLSEEWAVLGRSILYLVDNNGPAGGEKVQGRWQAGFAWRQAETDRWNALMKYEFKYEDDTSLPGLDIQRQVNQILLDVNFQPSADWIFSGHYGGKYVIEESFGLNDSYDAHLVAFRLTYEIDRRWDLGFNSSALWSGRDGSIHYGLGPEVGVTLMKSIRLGVGYNVFGFHDPDLSAEQYTDPGVYIALRMKFDETLFQGGDE